MTASTTKVPKRKKKKLANSAHAALKTGTAPSRLRRSGVETVRTNVILDADVEAQVRSFIAQLPRPDRVSFSAACSEGLTLWLVAEKTK